MLPREYGLMIFKSGGYFVLVILLLFSAFGGDITTSGLLGFILVWLILDVGKLVELRMRTRQ
jgi:hypothetical protein